MPSMGAISFNEFKALRRVARLPSILISIIKRATWSDLKS